MAAPDLDSHTAALHRLLADQRQAVIAVIDQALRLPSAKVGEEVDIAERGLVRLRDGLIDWLRQKDSPEASRWRGVLDRVNAVLSLVVGVEYPLGGIQRKSLEQARATLEAL